MSRRSVSSSGAGSISAGRDITGDVTTYVGGPPGTPLRLAVQPVEKVFDLVRVDDFTGRRWLVDQYDEFAGNHRSGYFLIEADAGLGKTSFAAWLVARRGYPGHFTRLPGGRDRRAALRNLGTRLIVDLDLFPDIEQRFMVPDLDRTLVPEWVDDPASFAALLDLAADKAMSREHTITLVVDGLDEEQPHTTPVPLGLPAHLPTGVHVVATCRTGTTLELDQTVCRVAPITAEDPRNLADMREYLAIASVRPGLAQRLYEHGMQSEDFVERITAQCGGVWIYLSSLLPDIAAGELDLGDLRRLPPRLSQYFAANLARRTRDPHWTSQDLPVLGTLAAAFEAVGLPMLSEVTGVSRESVGEVCWRRYRAFLRVTRTGGMRRFAVYHRSLNEFMSGEVPDDPALSVATLDLMDELSEHVSGAHRRIADFYLARLDVDPAAWASLHSGYGTRHLIRHLRMAGRHQDIRRVLYPVESRWELWRAVDADAYTQDVVSEIEAARRRTDQDTELRRDSESLRFEVAAALFLAGQAVEPGTGFVDLLEPLLKFGVWRTGTAIRHVLAIENPTLLARSLLAVVPLAAPEERPTLLTHAHRAAESIRNPVDQVFVQAELLAYSPSDVFRLAEQARELPDPVEAATALLALLPHGGHSLYTEALSLLRQGEDPLLRAAALVEAARFASPEDVETLAREALSLAASSSLTDILVAWEVPDVDHHAMFAADLLALAPSRLRESLWHTLYTLDVPETYEGVRRLTLLATNAPTSATSRHLEHRALALARTLPDRLVTAHALMTVYEALPA
ncbi:hypothetical protein [Saccharothrix sp. Mg75]|uniref:hypothetical protein n=1 Tax=Saccharothrix sp. Mg75 TaxID=3445357 RepID=UPI003EEF9CA9